MSMDPLGLYQCIKYVWLDLPTGLDEMVVGGVCVKYANIQILFLPLVLCLSISG